MESSVRPVLIATQCAPPSILLNTPLFGVPAYTVAGIAGSTAKTAIGPPPGPPLVQMPTPPHVVLPRQLSETETAYNSTVRAVIRCASGTRAPHHATGPIKHVKQIPDEFSAWARAAAGGRAVQTGGRGEA